MTWQTPDVVTVMCQHPVSASNDDDNDVEDRIKRKAKTTKKSFTYAIGNL